MSQPPTERPSTASSWTSPLFGDLLEEIVRGVLREQLPGPTAAEAAEEVRARIVRLQSAWHHAIAGRPGSRLSRNADHSSDERSI